MDDRASAAGDMTDLVDAESRRVIDEVMTRLDVIDEEAARVVQAGVVAALLAGVRIGLAETVAVVREQGFDLNLKLSIPDVSFDELLDGA